MFDRYSLRWVMSISERSEGAVTVFGEKRLDVKYVSLDLGEFQNRPSNMESRYLIEA
jgi:hypothetical protein